MAIEDLAALEAHRRAIAHLVPLLEAVRSVAEIAWRRAEAAGAPLRAYTDRIETMLAAALGTLDPRERAAVLAPWSATGAVGLLVVTSERGLCGRFNHRLVDASLAYARTLTEQGQPVHFLLLGSRGRRLLDEAGQPVLFSRPLPSLGLPAYADVEAIALDLLDLVEQETLRRLVVVHHAPTHQFGYERAIRTLLPAEVRALPRHANREAILPVGDASTLISHLFAEALLVGIYRAIVESAISEQMARILAMRLASDNARDLLDRLTLDANLARKQAATNSLLEIIAGYDATAEP